MRKKAGMCVVVWLLVMVQAVRVWGVDIIKALPPATQQLTLEMIRTATKAPGSPSPGALVPVTGRGPNGKLVQGTGQIPWAAIALMLAGSAVWVWNEWDHLVAVKDYFTLADITKNPSTPGTFTRHLTGYTGSTNSTCAANYPGSFAPQNSPVNGGFYANSTDLINAHVATEGGAAANWCGHQWDVQAGGSITGSYWNGTSYQCKSTATVVEHRGTYWYGVYPVNSCVGTVGTVQGEQVAADVAAIVAALGTYGAANSANQDAMIKALNELSSNMVAQTVGQPSASTPNVTTGVNDTPVPTGYSFPGSPSTAGQNFVYQWYINAPTSYTDITNQAGDTTVTNVIPETDTSWLTKLLEWFRNAIGLGEAPPDSGGIPPTDHGSDEGDPTPGENQKQILLIPDDPDPEANPMGPDRGAVQEKQNTFLANLLGELVDLTAGFRSEVSGLMGNIGQGNSQCSMTGSVFGVDVPINFCQVNFGSLAPIITTMFCIACLLIIIGG